MPDSLIDAVIFDLDGVLVDSEQLWSRAREQVTQERGGRWRADATTAMMGMSSLEWSRYMHDELRVDVPPHAISSAVVARLEALYREHLPLLPGAHEAVATIAAHWRLGLASSSNREIIDLVLELGELGGFFEATVSSEEVPRGKPAPDVYLETARQLRASPHACVAIEDSTNGLLAAAASAMKVVAVPNPHFPPDQEALQVAAVVIHSLHDLRPELVAAAGTKPPI
jgi:HAD superfamily hydrolase (TIGR01509 family)